MGLDHRLCNGQPYAISPLAGVSRGIPPVKPVKHILQQFLAQHFRRVLHRQAQVFALSGQTQGDLPALRRIFQCVVQKDGHQLHQAFLLAHQGEHRLNIHGQRLVLALGHRLERLGGLGHQFGEGQRQKLLPSLLLLHAGQVD